MMAGELVARLMEREAELEERLERSERDLSILRREAIAIRKVMADPRAVRQWIEAMQRTDDAKVLEVRR
jgi:DNA gyrase/topoisomerase IV subunit A